jgi:hypothetical protein
MSSYTIIPRHQHRDKREGQQEDPDEHLFLLHHTNWTAC